MDDTYFMREALVQAHKAYNAGEVPIGAVVVAEGKIIARAYNKVKQKKHSLAHAELIAIDKAIRKADTYLDKATLYVTIEPCIMCAGAMLKARLKCLVYGGKEPKGGGVHSMYTLLEDNRLNHKVQVVGGVLGSECGELMSNFFSKQRQLKKGKL